jgi:peptidyl-prolyl cis-trans isomerase SurA
MQNKRLASVTRIAGCALVLTLAAGPAAADKRLVDGIAAQVGSDVVLVSEVLEMAAPIEEQMKEGGAPPAQIAAMRSEVLERLIEGRLIASVVRRMELSATQEEIDSAIRGIAQETGLTQRQLTESVASFGLTYDEYRAKIADEIERSKVINSLVRSQVRLEPDEIEEAFAERYGTQRGGGEEVHLFHLVVAFGTNYMRDMETACTIAKDGAGRIASGEFSFSDVARRISDSDPQTGGDMGWVHVDDLVGWMVPVVNELEPGEISEVVQTGPGCHLLEITDRREFKPATLEDVRARIENDIYRRKTETRYIEWLGEVREHTYIERKGAFEAPTGPADPVVQ